MPLRDHLRPPACRYAKWDSLNAMWPGTIVQSLADKLPLQYAAAPRVRLGALFEVDDESVPAPFASSDDVGGVATAVWAPPRPALTADLNPSTADEDGVDVYDRE